MTNAIVCLTWIFLCHATHICFVCWAGVDAITEKVPYLYIRFTIQMEAKDEKIVLNPFVFSSWHASGKYDCVFTNAYLERNDLKRLINIAIYGDSHCFDFLSLFCMAKRNIFYYNIKKMWNDQSFPTFVFLTNDDDDTEMNCDVFFCSFYWRCSLFSFFSWFHFPPFILTTTTIDLINGSWNEIYT